MVIRALVFDFDGLILETEMPAYQAWAEVYREFGHELPKELWLEYIGREGGWFDALAETGSSLPPPLPALPQALPWALDPRSFHYRKRIRPSPQSTD